MAPRASRAARSSLLTLAALLASLLSVGAAWAYSSDFESPAYSASPVGTPLDGQQGWLLPASSFGFDVHTYAGNVLGISQNPLGGDQFAASVGIGGSLNARADHHFNPDSADKYSFEMDMLVKHNGPTPAQINPLVFQTVPGGQLRFAMFVIFNDVNNPQSGSVELSPLDAGGNPLGFQLISSVSSDPIWGDVIANRWYRVKVTVNFDTRQFLEISIVDLSTAQQSVVDLTPLGWYISTGIGRANNIRLFGRSNAGEIAAFDNLNIIAMPVCGNGHVEIGEQCDDGNVLGRDGCSAACQLEVDTDGDGLLDDEDTCPAVSGIVDGIDRDADDDGCPDDSEGLLVEIAAAGLDPEFADSLRAPVRAARDAYARGRDNAGNNQLRAFINHVNAQRGKKVSEDVAARLIAMAENAIAQHPSRGPSGAVVAASGGSLLALALLAFVFSRRRKR